MTQDSPKPKPKFDYDVCISFAGEDRICSRQIADALKARGVRVFYDEYERSELWGKNLYTHLDGIYRASAQYCVMLISQHYARKLWTNFERERAQARAFQENEEYILPVRLDDTEIPGLLRTVGYVDLRTTAIADLVALVLAKLGPRLDGIRASVDELKPKVAVPVLVGMLKAADPSVRLGAIQKLRSLGPAAIDAIPALVSALADERAIADEAIRALGVIDPEHKVTCGSLVGTLESDDQAAQNAAGKLLAKFGSLAVRAMVDALERKGEVIRANAESVLENVGPSGVPELVAAALSTRSELARDIAVKCLSRFRARELSSATPTLIVSLADKREVVRETVVKILGIVAPGAPWISTLRDAVCNPTGRREMPEMRSYSFYEPGDHPIMAHVYCPDLEGLKELEVYATPALLSVIELGHALVGTFEDEWYRQVEEVLKAMGPCAAGLLRMLLVNPNQELRERASLALSVGRWPTE